MGRGREALPALLTAGMTNDEDNKRESIQGGEIKRQTKKPQILHE